MKLNSLFFVCAFVILCTACGAKATPTPLPTATYTPLPTLTSYGRVSDPTPTNTPQPTVTPTALPSATSTPRPTATLTPTATLAHPVIRAGNANRITQLARIGKGKLRQTAYSPDGKFIVIASTIGVYLYNAGSLDEVNFLETPARVNCIAFSPDGTLLAAGLENNTLVLWLIEEGEILRTQELNGVVNSIAFSPDGSLLAGGYWEGVQIWKTSDGSLFRAIRLATNDNPSGREVFSVAFSPDGKTLATGSRDAKTRLWQVSNGDLVHQLSGPMDSISSVAFSPDGKYLASAASSADGTIWFWQTSDGRLFRRLSDDHLSYPSNLSFSPDGRYLVVVGGDQTIGLWQLADYSFTIMPASPASYVAFSPDSKMLATASITGVEFWQVDSRKLARTLNESWANVNCVALSPDGTLLAAGYEDGQVKLWQARDQSPILALSLQNTSVESIAFSPDGTLLAAGANDAKVRIWNTKSWALLHTLDNNLWDWDYWRAHVNSLAFSPDGTILAVGSVLTVNSGKSYGHLVLWQVAEAEMLWYRSCRDWVFSVSFSPDGSLLALKDAAYLEVFNVFEAIQSGETGGGYPLLLFIENNAFTQSPSAVFSPDGIHLAMAGGSDISLYQISEEPTFIGGFDGHESSVQSLAFSPDGSLLISGAWDNTLRVWQVSDQSLLITLGGHTLFVNSVAYSPDGTLLASASMDGTVRLWGIP